MLEDRSIRIKGSGAEGLVAADSGMSLGIAKAAVCPKCGEVSLYTDLSEISK